MKKLSLKNLLITISFAFVFLFLSIVVPTKFSAITPGQMSLVETNIQIDDVENSTNFYTTSVYHMTKLTPIFKIFLEIGNKNNVYPETTYESSISRSDNKKMGQISKEYSFYSSLINAYLEANKIDNSISLNYEINSLIVYYRPSHIESLEVGDIVKTVGGQTVTKENYKQIISGSKVDNLNIEVLRNGELHEITISYLPGDYYVSFYPNILITNSTPSYQLPGLNSRTGGPSGGMMQAINIYASLLNLNFGNLKIGGTGEIDLDGNIKKIGGAVQKIFTAEKYKMDVFLMAQANDEELPDIEFSFDYYAVKTFQQAIEKLEIYLQ